MQNMPNLEEVFQTSKLQSICHPIMENLGILTPCKYINTFEYPCKSLYKFKYQETEHIGKLILPQSE
jgi:hypothetical protein